MKKLLLVLFVLLAIVCPLFAVNYGDVSSADFSTKSAKAAVKFFEDKNIDTWLFITDEGEDLIIVEVDYNGEIRDLYIYFDTDSKAASFLMWDFVVFEDAQYQDMLEAVNYVNGSYRWLTYNVEDDNTVTLGCDCFFPSTGSSTVAAIFEHYYDSIEIRGLKNLEYFNSCL